MNIRGVHLGSCEHIAVQQLLPWYVSGRLDADEKNDVSEHLAGCAACRLELDIERRQQRQLRRVDVDESSPSETAAVEAGWSAMKKRIADADADIVAIADADRAAAPPTQFPGRSKFSRAAAGSRSGERRRRWWPSTLPAGGAWAVPAVLSVALALVLGFNLYSQPAPSGEFHTLAAPPVAAAQVLVRFRPEASEAQIRGSLNDSGGRLIDGPTVTDAYVVGLPRDRYAASLDLLRANPAVQLVEALDPTTTP